MTVNSYNLEGKMKRYGKINENYDEPEIITGQNSLNKIGIDARTVATADDSLAFVKDHTSMT